MECHGTTLGEVPHLPLVDKLLHVGCFEGSSAKKVSWLTAKVGDSWWVTVINQTTIN
jgi:hypothetical protein